MSLTDASEALTASQAIKGSDDSMLFRTKTAFGGVGEATRQSLPSCVYNLGGHTS
jgi:hypothetical protein